MISVSKLLCGLDAEGDGLRYDAAGESLYLITDRRPGKAESAFDDLVDAPPEVTTARKRPDVRAVRITKRDAHSACEEAMMTQWV